MASTFFGITDTGRKRDNNEDTFIAEKVLNDQYIMACVIDGVGGYEGGEVAADIARTSILEYFSVPSGDVITMMKEAFVSANQKIYAAKQKDTRLKSMACVATLALVSPANNLFYYAHVGDTRLYLLRDETLVKITKDHSCVGFLEDSGKLDEKAAMSHIKRNEIDKALGFDGKLSLTSNYIETGESPFLPGDIILLCSDGLTDLVTNAAMTSVLASEGSLEAKGKTLIDAANDAGGKDNITVVLVYNDSAPVKVKATKPKVVKKKDAPKSDEPIETIQPTAQLVRAKNNNGLVLVLALVCAALLAGFFWLLMRKDPKMSSNEDNPEVQLEQTPVGNKLQDTINRLTSDTLILSAASFGNDVQLSDIIFIEADTLHIKALTPVRFFADSTYSGPAFALSSTCRHISFENIVIENFETGIRAETNALTLKNVQFINCGMPVQYGFQFRDGEYVTGSIKNSTLFKTDSLPKR